MSDKSDAFAKQVETVVSDFEASLSGRDWSMRRDPKRMRDEIGNVYTVQSLTLIKGPVRLLLDPNGYDFPERTASWTFTSCRRTTPSQLCISRTGSGLFTPRFRPR
jgi:hypothetical protein